MKKTFGEKWENMKINLLSKNQKVARKGSRFGILFLLKIKQSRDSKYFSPKNEGIK